MVSLIKGAAAYSLTLFGFHGSSTTNRIRIALAVKGIPYKFETVDEGPANEQRSDEWKANMNALAQIPVLKVETPSATGESPAVLLRQSLAICEFLDDAYPDTPEILPRNDPIQRAKIREVAEIVNSFIQPMQNKLTVELIAKMDPALAEWLPKAIKHHIEGGHGDEEIIAPMLWPHEWIHKGFTAIERLIDDDSSKFCFGNTVTLADCALVPQVIGAKKYMLDLKPFPRIMRVYRNVMALETVKTTMADVLERL